MLIPYSSYSLRFVLTVLEAYFLHAHTVEEICETYQIAHSTLYVFRSLFLSHKRLILGVLDDAQEKASGFIGKIDGKQLFQFWIPSGIPFSRHTMRQISITAEISVKAVRMLPIIPACTI